MTTLAEITQAVAERLPTKRISGAATGGSTSTLIDTVNLTQADDYWKIGPLWILSGTYSGSVLEVTASSQANKRLTFAALATAIVAGVKYLVSHPDFPYQELVRAVNLALDEIGKTVAIDATLAGVSGTYVYTLPTGVFNLVKVELVRDSIPYLCSHCTERNGTLIFDTGYSPQDGDVIRLHWLKAHANLSVSTDAVDDDIDIEYLTWTAAIYALRWGLAQYQKDPQRNVAEWLNEALGRQEKAKKSNRGVPEVMVRTSGW